MKKLIIHPDAPMGTLTEVDIEEPSANRRCSASAGCLVEDDLSPEQIDKIHKFGEEWIREYKGRDTFLPVWQRREHFEKAMWLYAWDKKVIFSDNTVICKSLDH